MSTKLVAFYNENGLKPVDALRGIISDIT